MKKAAGKMLPYAFVLGLCVTLSGVLWLALYFAAQNPGAASLLAAAGACLALQIIAFAAGKLVKKAAAWPGALMLLCAPAALWSAFAGPRAFFGEAAQLLEMWEENSGPLLPWAATPVMAGGVLACAAWALCGLLAMAADFLALAKNRAAKKMRAALAAQPAEDILPRAQTGAALPVPAGERARPWAEPIQRADAPTPAPPETEKEKKEAITDPIILVRPNESLESRAIGYRQEHFASGESVINGSELWDKTDDYGEWLIAVSQNSRPETVNPKWVLTDTFFALRPRDGQIVGMIDLRHELNDFLKDFGHCGYSVRPGERRKGYATEMLRQLLFVARAAGLTRLQLSCEKGNIPSQKTIVKNGGVYERSFRFGEEMADVFIIEL